MPDSKRDILLHIAATAEFKELKALNTELKESINTVARLRSMLKGDVGGTGLRGAAASAVEASKAQRKFKEEVEGVNASLQGQYQKLDKTSKLIKTTTSQKTTSEGSSTIKTETYDVGEGLRKEIKLRNGVVQSIRDVNAIRQRENTELKKTRDLEKGAIWQADQERAREWKKRQGVPWRQRSPDEVIDRANIENMQRDFGIARRMNADFNRKKAEDARKFRQEEARATKEIRDTGDTVPSMAGKVAMWTLATSAIYGTIRAVKAGVTAFSELEQGTVALARVGRGFSSDQNEIASAARNVTSEILKLSVQYGASASDAQTAAVTFARLGLSQRDTIEAVRVSMLAANVANIGLAESATLLSSAMQQFGMSVRDLPAMLNRLNTLENTTKTTTNDMLQAIGRTGSVWREAGGSLDALAASVAVVQQTTSRTGPEIGNAFKTIASRLLDAKTQMDLFKKAGIDVQSVSGDLMPIGDVLGELVVKFQSMSQAERAQLTTQMAGIRQRNILQAQLDNYFQIQAQVIRQYNEVGSAEKENAMVMETLSKKLESLMSSFTQFAASIGDSLVGSALKKLVDGLSVAIGVLTKMGSVGVVIVGALAAYAVAVVFAATKTTMLGATFKALWGGIQQVNASLLGLVGIQNSVVAANARLIASNASASASFEGLALSSAKAATANVTGGIAGTGAFIARAAPVGMLSKLGPYGVAAAGAYGLFKGIGYLGSRGYTYDRAGGEEKLARNEAAIESASNRRKALQEQIKFADTAAQAMEKLEERERSGQALSASQLNTRAQINNTAREALSLTGQEERATRRLALTSRDLLVIRDRLAKSGATGRSVVSLLETQLSDVEKELEKARVEQGYQKGAKGEGGILSWWSKGFVWSPEELNAANQNVSDLQKQQDALKTRIKEAKSAEQEAKKAEEKGPGGQALILELERLDQALTKISDHDTAIADALSADALSNATSKLAIARRELEALEKSAAFQWGDEDQQKKLREPREKAVQQAENRVVVEGLKKRAETEKEKMDQTIDLRRDFVKRYAEVGVPDEYKGIAGAKAQYEETLKMKDQLETALRSSEGADAFTKDGRYARPGDVEYDTKVTSELNMRLKIAELEKQALRDQANIEMERRNYAAQTTEQMKQQYETTRKMLGGMSDVDMARARITAGRFKRGELTQMGNEGFNLPAEMRKTFADVEGLFPGMRIMPEVTGAPMDWFTRKERQIDKEQGWDPRSMYEQKYGEAGRALSISMNIGDAENKIDALGNSLIAYLSTNIGQLWDELIARTDAAARPPQTKKVQGTVR
jgi:TP901 family phage tail tape measure protein